MREEEEVSSPPPNYEDVVLFLRPQPKDDEVVNLQRRLTNLETTHERYYRAYTRITALYLFVIVLLCVVLACFLCLCSNKKTVR